MRNPKVALSTSRHMLTSRRLQLGAALLACAVLALVWSEGIADAEQVNPAGGVAASQVHDEAPNNQAQPAAAGPLQFVIAAVGVLALWIFFASGWHHLRRVPRRPHLITPAMGFILVALLLVAAGIGIAAVRSLFSIEGDIDQQAHPVRAYALLAGGTHLAQLLVLILLVFLWSKHRRLMHDTRPKPISAVWLGLAALTLFWPIVMLASFLTGSIVTFITGKPIEPIAHDTLALFSEHRLDGWMVLLIVLVVFTAPLIEEVMYRGVVQEALGQLGLSRWTAIILTSIFFALMHLGAVESHALATLFVLSIGFGWIYEKTGRLAAPIAMHAAFNAGNLALVMAGVAS